MLICALGQVLGVSVAVDRPAVRSNSLKTPQPTYNLIVLITQSDDCENPRIKSLVTGAHHSAGRDPTIQAAQITLSSIHGNLSRLEQFQCHDGDRGKCLLKVDLPFTKARS